ncbi:MAG: Rrf2 family transcriptional regulator [Alteromonadaceae bacterium]|nr:Rrf2 family transcriptional regulator [Alteromonadaceae bacterium]
MQLTKFSDYGFRVLIYIALLPANRLANIDEISEAYGISRNVVNKVVHQLARGGIIQTKRGQRGGFKLLKQPETINVGDIVVLLEPTLNIIDCTSPHCNIVPACRLKHIFNDASEAFVRELKNYYLSDVIKNKNVELRTILEIE